jgi:AcrR family transcriptional regulator
VTEAVPKPDLPRRPGRPRDPRVDQAILQATMELLAEEGFEGMSMEGVAARAGVGKTAIYRRWASKEELVTDLIRQIHTEVPVVDTGNLRDDLLTLMRSAGREAPRLVIERLLPRFLAEASSNPALFEAYSEATIAPRLRRLIEMLERARERGEIRPDVDPTVVVDVLAGALMFRQLLTGRVYPTPPDYAEQLIEMVWSGLTVKRLEPSRPGPFP